MSSREKSRELMSKLEKYSDEADRIALELGNLRREIDVAPNGDMRKSLIEKEQALMKKWKDADKKEVAAKRELDKLMGNS